MKHIPIKTIRTHVGITLPGTTTNSIDVDRLCCNIFLMPWGFDIFYKGKKYGVGFANVTAWEYDLDYKGKAYEQCDKLCTPGIGEGKQAISA